MDAVIHIGLPKCGSTSIQGFLALNAEGLAARGIRYAPCDTRFTSQIELGIAALDAVGAGVANAHARRVFQLETPADMRQRAATFAAFLDAGIAQWPEALYVASSEHLAVWLDTPEKIAALDTFLTARFASVRYVVYLRPQSEIVLSNYSEGVHRGSTESFEAYLGHQSGGHNHRALVRRWEKALGEDRLSIRLLTPDFLTDSDLIADYCAQIGTLAQGLTRPPRLNSAMTDGEIRVRRVLNRVLALRKSGGGSNLVYRGALKLAHLLRLTGGAPHELPRGHRAAIEAQYAESNERLRARYFPDRKTLF
ncbi:hypothetical protein LCM17_08280 [Cereibacter sphaeroides]|nr:hypothetical protein [Cereibacter sphaeroides]